MSTPYMYDIAIRMHGGWHLVARCPSLSLAVADAEKFGTPVIAYPTIPDWDALTEFGAAVVCPSAC